MKDIKVLITRTVKVEFSEDYCNTHSWDKCEELERELMAMVEARFDVQVDCSSSYNFRFTLKHEAKTEHAHNFVMKSAAKFLIKEGKKRGLVLLEK